MDKLYHFLVAHRIEEAIAGNNKELVLGVVDLVDPDLGH